MDKAAANYLTVLAWGRRVLLMDTAILQSKFPKHKLFKLKCFQLPAEGCVGTELQQKWKQYRDDVVAAHNRTPAEHLEVCSMHLLVLQLVLCIALPLVLQLHLFCSVSAAVYLPICTIYFASSLVAAAPLTV